MAEHQPTFLLGRWPQVAADGGSRGSSTHDASASLGRDDSCVKTPPGSPPPRPFHPYGFGCAVSGLFVPVCAGVDGLVRKGVEDADDPDKADAADSKALRELQIELPQVGSLRRLPGLEEEPAGIRALAIPQHLVVVDAEALQLGEPGVAGKNISMQSVRTLAAVSSICRRHRPRA